MRTRSVLELQDAYPHVTHSGNPTLSNDESGSNFRRLRAARDLLLPTDPMDSGGATLVVSEDGAGEHKTAVPPELHIVQRSGEPAHDLKRRVLVTLRRLRASGRPLSSAVLAAGQGSGDDVQAARLFIACALLRVMSGVPGATLVLAASSAETRHDLLGLADALLAELGTRGVRLRVVTTRDSKLRAVRLPALLRASA